MASSFLDAEYGLSAKAAKDAILEMDCSPFEDDAPRRQALVMVAGTVL
jgi:hypothetical protein